MINHIVSYEIASIPIFIIIIMASVSRRLTKGRTNRILFWIVIMSLVAAVGDFLSYVVVQRFPLEDWQVTWVIAFNYVYFISRYSLSMLYIFFFYAVSHTWYRIAAFWKRLLISIPYGIIAVMYTANLWLHHLYDVTNESGYQRGDAVAVTAVIGSFYVVYGIVQLVKYRKYMEVSEWMSIGSIYVLNVVGILIQLFKENLVIESYFTALTILFLVLYVQKPEKQLDPNTGLPGCVAFQDTMKKIELTGEKVQVVIACIENADELSKFMGERVYSDYIHIVDQEINEYARKEKIPCEFYYEEPGMLFFILEDTSYNPVQGIPAIRERVQKATADFPDTGMRVALKVVTAQFPGEVPTVDGVTHLAQRMVRYASEKIYYHAPQIIEQRNYQIEQHFDDIYRRSVNEGGFETGYAPVYSCAEGKHLFAWAVYRINDPEYGQIDQETVEMIARDRGALGMLEEHIIEQTFSYVGSGAMSTQGLSYIVIRLSSSLAMQKNFTDHIWNMRSKYNLHAEQICFAFTELGDQDASAGLLDNIKKLTLQGYRVALDGYGNGSLNIRRISELSVNTVRLDQSLIDEMELPGGEAVLRGMIGMLQSIPLTVVVPGVDDEKTRDRLLDMGCDLMMGKLFVMETSEHRDF